MKLFALSLATLAFSGALLADPITDGVVNPGEYNYITTLNPYVNGSTPADGTQSVQLYWATNSTTVFGAVVGDLSDPSQPFANIYVYSSGPSTNLTTNVAGTYGDGDDVIIEAGANGNADWGFADPSGIIPATKETITTTTSVDGIISGSEGGVSFAYDEATLTEEFSISKSLLGNYDVLRFGGQLFTYEFNTGSTDRVPGALVPEDDPLAATPEPSTWMMLASGLVLIPLYRRKK